MRLKQFIISLLFVVFALTSVSHAESHDAPTTEISEEKKPYVSKSLSELASSWWSTTGINALIDFDDGEMTSEPKGAAYERKMNWFESSLGRIIMIFIVFILFYLAIAKNFEPLLLIPIAFGGLLANIPLAGMGGEHGMLGIIYNMGIANEFSPY